jgi:SAM-dependent methyltransferase
VSRARRRATPAVPADPGVRAFVAESPINRSHIAAFVAEAARSLPPGAQVLDAGAGVAPYRALFAHVRYTTADWGESMHPEALASDVVAPLDALPLADGAFDAVLATEVLEHVPDSVKVLRELHRVLVPGGRLWLTTPFVWELHEEPHDHARYTPFGLRELLRRAGFADVTVQPFGGWFATVGQVLRSYGSVTGRGAPGRPLPGRLTSSVLWRAGPLVARLDRDDARRGLPLGYGTAARKPFTPAPT